MKPGPKATRQVQDDHIMVHLKLYRHDLFVRDSDADVSTVGGLGPSLAQAATGRAPMSATGTANLFAKGCFHGRHSSHSVMLAGGTLGHPPLKTPCFMKLLNHPN